MVLKKVCMRSETTDANINGCRLTAIGMDNQKRKNPQNKLSNLKSQSIYNNSPRRLWIKEIVCNKKNYSCCAAELLMRIKRQTEPLQLQNVSSKSEANSPIREIVVEKKNNDIWQALLITL